MCTVYEYENYNHMLFTTTPFTYNFPCATHDHIWYVI